MAGALADPNRVRRELNDRVEELRTGALRILDVEVRRVRIKKETWTTLYHLCNGRRWICLPRFFTAGRR